MKLLDSNILIYAALPENEFLVAWVEDADAGFSELSFVEVLGYPGLTPEAEAFFEQVFKAPHAVSPDELQKTPKPATIVEVADRLTLKDETGEIRLYNIPSPHAQGMLVSHITSADLMWITDQYSAGRDTRKSPGAVHLYETLKQLGVRPARFAGGHGSSGTYEEFEAIHK